VTCSIFTSALHCPLRLTPRQAHPAPARVFRFCPSNRYRGASQARTSSLLTAYSATSPPSLLGCALSSLRSFMSTASGLPRLLHPALPARIGPSSSTSYKLTSIGLSLFLHAYPLYAAPNQVRFAHVHRLPMASFRPTCGPVTPLPSDVSPGRGDSTFFQGGRGCAGFGRGQTKKATPRGGFFESYCRCLS